MATTVSTGYVARKQFTPFHARTQRWSCIVSHPRCGKTVASINDLIDAALRCRRENPRFAYVAPFFAQAKDIAWSYLKHYTAPIPGVQHNESELRIDIRDKRIRLYGADNYERLRGIYLDGVVLDEYGDMDPRAWPEVIRPRLADRGGWAAFIGTAHGYNHFAELAEQAMASPDWFYTCLRASETGILPRAELEDARRAMSEEQYLAEFECFPAGTMIATTRGNLPIERIRVGDSVLTHRGRWRPVTATMVRQHEGELVAIDAIGLTDPLRCTGNHPFLVHDKTTQERDWKDALDLSAGDCLVLPRIKGGMTIISEDQARLIAWFICEGSVTGNHVSFSCNPNNQNELDRVAGILRACGYEPKIYPANPGVICVLDATLADMLVAWCGSRAAAKRIPFDIIAGRESEVFEELMLGDGCSVEPVQGSHRWAYTTISRGLALDVQLLAGTFNRRAGIVTREPALMVSPNNGATYQGKLSYAVQIPKGVKVNHSRHRECFPTSHGMAYRIRRVWTEPFSGLVYNLSIKEDESYVANGRAVHNCSFQAAIVGSIWGRELSVAEQEGRICHVPHDPAAGVSTWWDLGIRNAMAIWFTQDIGREVRVIDHCEMIGGGLPEAAQELRRRPYRYVKHHAPHDAKVRELGTGKSRIETAASLGIEFELVPDIGLEDGIQAARLFFARCVFDREKTARGRDALASYHRAYDAKRKIYSATPVHDFSSDSADAWRYLAVGHKFAAPVRRERALPLIYAGGSGNSSWMGA